MATPQRARFRICRNCAKHTLRAEPAHCLVIYDFSRGIGAACESTLNTCGKGAGSGVDLPLTLGKGPAVRRSSSSRRIKYSIGHRGNGTDFQAIHAHRLTKTLAPVGDSLPGVVCLESIEDSDLSRRAVPSRPKLIFDDNHRMLRRSPPPPKYSRSIARSGARRGT